MKIVSILLLSIGALVLGDHALQAQQSAEPLPETRVVLRISRSFIHHLLGIQFAHDEPIDSNASSVSVTGNANAAGKLDVRLHESDTSSEFDVSARGDISMRIVATRRPVQVYAHGDAPFSVRRRIVLDGNGITGQAVEVQVANHFNLDQICTFRGGAVGALTRGIARPIVRRGLLDGDRQADQQICQQLSKSFADSSNQMIGVLTQVDSLAKQGLTVLQKEKVLKDDWTVYRAATKHHLLISVGLPGRRIATVPKLDKAKRAPIELWIALPAAGKQDYVEFFKKHWGPIQKIVHEQIRRRSPELAKELDGKATEILAHVRVETVAGWHVVTFAPGLVKLPTFEIP